MGTWGVGLYSNDCACDVRDTYMGFLKDQMPNNEAYLKMLDRFGEYIGDEEEPLFWYAFADTQWKVGRLVPEVREKALGWIGKEGGIDPWIESKNGGAGWKKTLEKLKTKLESPQPLEKKIRKPQEYVQNPWEVGDLYAFQFQSEESKQKGLFGKFLVFQKIGDEEWKDSGKIWKCSRIQVFDRAFERIPELTDLNEVRILPQVMPSRYFFEHGKDQPPLQMNSLFFRNSKRSFPEKQFYYVGNQSDRFGYPVAPFWRSLRFWMSCEEDMIAYFAAWQHESYRVTEQGVFLNC